MSKKFYRNQEIRAREVRVIADDGTQLGLMSIDQARQAASEKGLDLVEVAPNVQPPVCKIMDWGKFKYEQEKQAQAQKKKQKMTEIKGIRLSSKIGEHDLETKSKRARTFLEKGDKVKVSLLFKGREITHKEIGEKVLIRFAEGLSDVANIEQQLAFSGREVNVVLAPKKA